MYQLKELLKRSAALHSHLCPRQVLGVRMGLLAAELLVLDLPQRDKRLITFMETDGCAADGVSIASGCRVGRRTMRILDYGKVAATFADTTTGRAVRIWPNTRARDLARQYTPGAEDDWHAMLDAYQVMPAQTLLVALPVCLAVSLETLISQPGLRVVCMQCGEEIMNGREVFAGGEARCRSCAGEAYYNPVSLEDSFPLSDWKNTNGLPLSPETDPRLLWHDEREDPGANVTRKIPAVDIKNTPGAKLRARG